MQTNHEPTDAELDSLEDLAAEAEEAEPIEDSIPDVLDDLFAEATAGMTERKLRKPKRSLDPSLREALDAASKKLRESYTNPSNWKRARNLVLVDKETKSVLGNFAEFLHIGTSARKLERLHEPCEIHGQEEIEGWLGHAHAAQFHGVTWDREVSVTCHVELDEVQVDAPNVKLKVFLLLNSIVRVEVEEKTQFARASGNMLLILQPGTDIWAACGVDTKAALRKAVLA